MKSQPNGLPANVAGISLFVLSFLFILFELIKLNSSLDIPFYTLNLAIALTTFTLSAYFCFVGRFRIKYPDLIYSVYSLQFLLILFVWLVRFGH